MMVRDSSFHRHQSVVLTLRPIPVHAYKHEYSAQRCALLCCWSSQELRRRFEKDGSSATAFAVHPGNNRTDLWSFVPCVFHMPMDLNMVVCFLSPEQVHNTASTL